MARDLLCAVDVGTKSARAGIVTPDGQLLAKCETPFSLRSEQPNHAEHDSEEIWRAVSAAVREALAAAGVGAERIAGIAFDATCSLVVRGEGGRQLPVSPSGKSHWDTIVWLDHRAIGEADECTASGHEVLGFIGGAMSPEMETPKLMWLKRNLPDTWKAARHFFDLTDFLSWRATGSTARSQCTLTAKWTYLAHEDSWREDFFESLGIGDMLEQGSLPAIAAPVGSRLGTLTPEAAAELGLDTSVVVGAGLIDAFAGALGVIGGFAAEEIDRHLALVAGTSSCIMGMSPRARPVSGVWGPYYGAALPGLWLFEGGQSVTGGLLDHVIRLFGRGLEADAETHQRIIARVQELRASEPDLGGGIHILPDFHGNRSPFANPHASGVVSGLTLDDSFDGLCRVYWRACVAIALGVRHILDHLNAHGFQIDTVHVTGGHTRNPLLMELYANATGCSVSLSETQDAVLLGTAMVAAAASGLHDDLTAAAAAMTRPETRIPPDPAAATRHERDYRIFLRMHEQRQEIDRMIQSTEI
ncbi:Ribulokinase [Hartmannibacter diazotrophicus]|uniref:Ribulokinase n=1 Tax=Hartmannibacter diazotrophicus TaxID=1482074 RepID=A0A2C9DE70_9HYPH|nr:FGGY-family carbohydrate kinase [Hartmannibacter diazotrophicus]SON58111.1 Ribulokinase [Hartmannibacter diazotrophicus]